MTMTAIAAVDTALWDIRGKTLAVPVYQLLGGASRDSVLVYGHANGQTEDDTVQAVQHYIGHGYRAIRAQCAIPGVLHAYGVGRGELHYEPAQKEAARERLEHGAVSRLRAAALRTAAARGRLRRPPAPRRAPSPDANRGGTPG